MNVKSMVLSTILFAQAISSSFAADLVNVKDRILTQKIYLNTYEDIFGNPDYARFDDFSELVDNLPKKKKKEVLEFVKHLDSKVPESILRPLVYWRFIKPDPKKVEKVLSFYMFYNILTIRDYIDNPTKPSNEKSEAVSILRTLTNENVTTENLATIAYPLIQKKAALMTKEGGNTAFASAIRNEKIISRKISAELKDYDPYVLSYLGIVKGNKVDVISENKRDLDRIKWLNDRVIFNGGSLDFDSDFIKMPTAEDPTGHIIFKEDPIYMKIRDMIDDSKDSVFIDIFLFGGTLGATLSEYLIDQALIKRKTNPDYKVLILHDYATNYNMLGEMMPVFEYIKKRIETEPEVAKTVSLLQANIQRHPPGIPFGITNLIPKTKETCKFMESKSTYYESKIDHSKVIVVDANTDKPQAYFGSKNWTDHSGGYYYDDAIYVKGPSAALVQASYYRDIEAALTEDKLEQDCFYFKEKGFDNKKYLGRKKEILDWFSIKKEKYPVVGDQPMRLAEADVDGTIKNVRNQLVDMIKNAKKNVYMEQLFIYDPYINDALIKRKLEVPDLDIKILADHNGNFGLNGLPNTLFIKEMQSYGIEIRARKTYGIPFTFPNGHEQEFHQENHRKITSVDGKVLLGGSSNLNPDTLQGSFREFGAQLYDVKVIGKFETKFLEDWHNLEKTMEMDIENFQATVGGKSLSIELSELINGIGSTLFRNKDKIEKRY